MNEHDDLTKIDGLNVQRSADEIRQDITAGRESISVTVDEINERIQEKLEWRGYVKRYPFVALGTAVGLGYLSAGFIKRRRSPMEQIMGAVTETIRDSLSGAISRAGGQGLVKLTLYGIATKVAVNFLRSTIADAIDVHGSGDHKNGGPGRHETSRPHSTMTEQHENWPNGPFQGEDHENEKQ